jgi:hypothetical protein
MTERFAILPAVLERNARNQMGHLVFQPFSSCPTDSKGLAVPGSSCLTFLQFKAGASKHLAMQLNELYLALSSAG